jgi:peptidoglycan L-alanyl-D-glutamate endopeptidase CwlK
MSLLNTANLEGVHPKLRDFARAAANALPFDVWVAEGVRSDARQRELYKLGRNSSGQIVKLSDVVTYAPDASQSAHGSGLAVDLWPLRDGRMAPSGAPEWEKLGALARASGLAWGGAWKAQFPPYGDQPHIEMPSWRDLRGWNSDPIASADEGDPGDGIIGPGDAGEVANEGADSSGLLAGAGKVGLALLLVALAFTLRAIK